MAFISPLAFLVIAFVIADAILSSELGYMPGHVLWLEIAVVAVAIPFSYLHSRKLVRPIEDLVPQAEGIARGRLEVSYHGDRNEIPEEMQSLARSINQIAEKQGRDFAAMQRLERVRSEFLGNVSHELRTPIFAVQGFIETLLDGAVDDPTVNRDFLARAQLQAERLNALLNDLIDISRIESGEMRMSFRMFDILPFLVDVVEDLKPLADQKQITIQLTPISITGDEIEVFGDKERLKQVMVNLVENAVKYTNPGGKVSIELRDSMPAENLITISVIDTGIGIAEEHLPRLFERFYRVDKDRSRSSPGGTGLGLAICKHIVEAHKSQISVTSVPGNGSTFSFTLRKEPF
jgi:two-component system phosphate regulon sensor histidine kinase PhoR